MKKIIFIILLFIFGFGCATSNQLQTISEKDIKNNTNTIIIGKFKEVPEPLMSRGKAYLTIKTISTKKTFTIQSENADKEGSYFYVFIPPGNYVTERFSIGNLSGYPHGRFDISNNSGKVIYLGTLLMKKENTAKGFLKDVLSGMLSGRTKISVKWEIIDEYDETVNRFKSKYPNLNKEILKKLIQM